LLLTLNDTHHYSLAPPALKMLNNSLIFSDDFKQRTPYNFPLVSLLLLGIIEVLRESIKLYNKCHLYHVIILYIIYYIYPHILFFVQIVLLRLRVRRKKKYFWLKRYIILCIMWQRRRFSAGKSAVFFKI